METILHRFARMLWADQPADISSAEKLHASLRPADIPDTFCWADLDYTDKTRLLLAARSALRPYADHPQGLRGGAASP